MDPSPLDLDPALRKVLSQLATDVTQRVHCCCDDCPPRAKGGWRSPLLFEHIINRHEKSVPKNWKCTYEPCRGTFFNTLDAISHKHDRGKSYIQPYYAQETFLRDTKATSNQDFNEKQTAWEKPWFIYNETMLINSVDKLIRDGYLLPGPRLFQQNERTGSSANSNAITENPSTLGVSYSRRRPPSPQPNREPPRTLPAPAPLPKSAVRNERSSTGSNFKSSPESVFKTKQQETSPKVMDELERRAYIRQLKEAESAKQSTGKSGEGSAQPSTPRRGTGTIRVPPIRPRERGESPPMAGSTTPRDRPHLSPRGGTSPGYQPNTPMYEGEDEEPVFKPSWERNQNQNPDVGMPTTPISRDPRLALEQYSTPAEPQRSNDSNQYIERHGEMNQRENFNERRSISRNSEERPSNQSSNDRSHHSDQRYNRGNRDPQQGYQQNGQQKQSRWEHRNGRQDEPAQRAPQQGGYQQNGHNQHWEKRGNNWNRFGHGNERPGSRGEYTPYNRRNEGQFHQSSSSYSGNRALESASRQSKRPRTPSPPQRADSLERGRSLQRGKIVEAKRKRSYSRSDSD
ncbi:unnamed protein product, partial [Mesorhabditis belari]|uniref:Uncharacterized protein n=1 Tax=Mesorhabditis belari TaxID=2138241 RepID=A0AAF3F3W6_9BILA